MSFFNGDLVQLKSGGPVMTVSNSDHKGVLCIWFDGPTKMSALIPADTLQKASPGESTIVDLFEVAQLANWYREQADYPDCLARAIQAVTTLGSHVPNAKAVELLRKIAKGGSSYPHECRVLALRYLGGA